MDLESYLQRIQYSGPVRADLECLRAVHRHHVQSIPYEDLDVQLGRPLDLDPERIRRKLIVERRGGWCYEMNGLLGWALEEIGFSVTRMTGGVMRSEEGDAAFGNHLVLRIDLDGESWIADAGLGDVELEAEKARIDKEMTVDQLKAELEGQEIPPNAKKPDLIELFLKAKHGK